MGIYNPDGVLPSDVSAEGEGFTALKKVGTGSFRIFGRVDLD